ncbi:PLP-dependent aminotransferase family protein [Priestia koreensis]|uniref:GntR family transcriptional regulator n=1 Tax=Priestia koreensis TaxID=284581 RepID=A0A0M0L019_9BACI|nr:PLP-dependent aminotransferase family protein [Priestia koreensis]KOO44212.1 GntR family transcriptional regulator [Priestia koreensis]
MNTTKTPKYQQIILYLKEKIANGEWPIGTKIPSQRVLAKQFDVNRSTVITALEELMADGLIEGQIGKGTVVINNTWTLLATNSTPNWDSRVKSGVHKPSQKMVQEINDKETDGTLIQLSKGELSPQLFPLNKMKQVMNEVTESITAFGYEEPKGYLPLREAVVEYVKEADIHVSADSVLIVSGALQALQLISVGILEKSSTVLLEKPSYLYSLRVFQSSGMRLKGVKMDKEGICLDAVERSEREARILYTNPSFHNPTGTLMTSDRRRGLLDLCEKKQLPVIEDDIYRELWLGEHCPKPLKSMDRHGHVLYVGSLSKTLSPGLRIGWVIGPEAVIERLADIKMQMDYGSSSLSQRVAAEWLSSGLYYRHVAEVRKELKKRRDFVVHLVNQYLNNMVTYEIPHGGLFLWLKINGIISMNDLYRKMLANGIVLNPGQMYGEDTSCIRLSYAYATVEELESGIQCLAEVMKSLMKNPV